ncbi:MAG: hypothetical protein QOF61_2369 [Acidobacteriota bacterium]|jgi:hypothetical protein|nr:hypothetical protein [Acidobacteriota bacterium]
MYASVVMTSLPEMAGAPEVFGERLRRVRAPSLESLVARAREMLGDEWLPRVYRESVRSLRTRSFQLPIAADDSKVSVQHTLLGVELKIGRRRLSCPDLATARYLSVFARAGCTEVAVPYDITKISRLADDLESSWQRTMLITEHLTEGRAKGFRTRLRKALVEEMRRGVTEAGAGAVSPQFKQDTKQRLYREPPSRARRA